MSSGFVPDRKAVLFRLVGTEVAVREAGVAAAGAADPAATRGVGEPGGAESGGEALPSGSPVRKPNAGQVQVGHEPAGGSQPARRPGQDGELVSDVVQSVQTGDQIERPRWELFGGAAERVTSLPCPVRTLPVGSVSQMTELLRTPACPRATLHIDLEHADAGV